jgi:hypothetical protein
MPHAQTKAAQTLTAQLHALGLKWFRQRAQNEFTAAFLAEKY